MNNNDHLIRFKHINALHIKSVRGVVKVPKQQRIPYTSIHFTSNHEIIINQYKWPV